ncbi:sugar transferase [Actinomycetospora soli]|uniref:sugar transferase n=1 Tax=Actinomycetospora soli TaxID=2893887 RepID=UPI001E563099|nr:sugar transferase [Actinomycetospora soli]MCD2190237.1 exopolysaccharide biosynthesis polyprenyl glycosylphosphotransferase [Actinomycetospora soli]
MSGTELDGRTDPADTGEIPATPEAQRGGARTAAETQRSGARPIAAETQRSGARPGAAETRPTTRAGGAPTTTARPSGQPADAPEPFVDPDPTAPGFIRIWDDEGPGQPGSVATATSWQSKFALAVAASDLLVLAVCAVLGALIGFGAGSADRGTNPWVLAAVSMVLVPLAIGAARAWDPRVLGQGSEEWSRLMRGYVSAAILLALAGLVLERTGVRPWVFGILPVAGLLSMAGRYTLRRWLHQARKRGRGLLPVLAIGTEESVRDLIERTRRVAHIGWVVTGACTPTGLGEEGQGHVAGVPVIGDLDSLPASVRTGRFGVVAVAQTPGWSPKRLHRLAWDLEGTGSELVVDPGLMEVAGPRLHVAPVDGLPLLRLTEPRLSGVPRIGKLLFDRAASIALVLALAPVFLLIALFVKLDGGPVFYRQTRVGLRGRTFRMVKFRSMVPDADRLRAQVVAGGNDGSGPLFKLRRDPRVTRIGSMLRRYSLDELPQLFNVVGGSMSLVGPRPPLPGEVDAYSDAAKRKFLVRPGMTGLWQVSGRSDLSWEESVRLDLRYVENWSPAMDLVILWKTVSAVFRGDGAY